MFIQSSIMNCHDTVEVHTENKDEVSMADACVVYDAENMSRIDFTVSFLAKRARATWRIIFMIIPWFSVSHPLRAKRFIELCDSFLCDGWFLVHDAWHMEKILFIEQPERETRHESVVGWTWQSKKCVRRLEWWKLTSSIQQRLSDLSHEFILGVDLVVARNTDGRFLLVRRFLRLIRLLVWFSKDIVRILLKCVRIIRFETQPRNQKCYLAVFAWTIIAVG